MIACARHWTAVVFAAAALSACGGGGGTTPGAGAAAVPSAAPTAATSALTVVSTSNAGRFSVPVGPIAGGISASLDVPAFMGPQTSLSASLSASAGAGIASPSSTQRVARSIGAAGITTLAYLTLSLASAAPQFYGMPAITFTLPPSITAAGGNAYLGVYDPSQGAWMVAAPGRPLSATITFVQTAGFFGSGSTATYALFTASGPVVAPTPAASPSPAPVTSISFSEPSPFEIGSLPASCSPSNDPWNGTGPQPAGGTYCSTYFSFRTVEPYYTSVADPGNYVEVRFRPLTGVSGTYTATVANPSLVALIAPFAVYDGSYALGLKPLAPGSTSVTVKAPNGQSSTLPLVFTALDVAIDSRQLSASDSFWADARGDDGSSFPLLRIPPRWPADYPYPGGASYTIRNAPATYESDPTDGNGNTTYRVLSPSAIVVHVVNGSNQHSRDEVFPLQINHGQSNTVTVTPSPVP